MKLSDLQNMERAMLRLTLLDNYMDANEAEVDLETFALDNHMPYEPPLQADVHANLGETIEQTVKAIAETVTVVLEKDGS